MQRRDLLRLASTVTVGGIFVPKFERWFHIFRPTQAIEVVSPHAYTITTSGVELNKIWRKVQGKLIAGYNFESDEWAKFDFKPYAG